MTARKIKWRLNKKVSDARVKFIDLFIDDVYQSIWLEHDAIFETWQFVAFDHGGSYRSPGYPTMEEAKEHYTTYAVIRRLEGHT